MTKYTLDDLDKLAAEKVMGWNMDITNSCSWSCGEWQPTKNIAQAWELLTKTIKDTGLSFNISAGSNDGVCVEVVDEYESRRAYEWGKNGAEAIVTACLKAKGVEID